MMVQSTLTSSDTAERLRGTAFVHLSPALYAREKKTVLPAAFVGLLLFIGGSLFAFFVLLPQALPILFSFQSEGLENLITFSEYFSFVTQLVLAMGLVLFVSLLAAAMVLALVWTLRAGWARLTGKPVTPWVMRMDPRTGINTAFRSTQRWSTAARGAPQGAR